MYYKYLNSNFVHYLNNFGSLKDIENKELVIEFDFSNCYI